MKHSTKPILFCLGVLLAAGCEKSMFTGSSADDAIKALTKTHGVPVLMISEIEIANDRATLVVQSDSNPDALTEMLYDLKTRVAGYGRAVRIRGGSSAKDMVFPASAFDFTKVAAMTKTIAQKTNHKPWLWKIATSDTKAGRVPQLISVEIEGGELAMFNLDGSLYSFSTKADREKVGAQFK